MMTRRDRKVLDGDTFVYICIISKNIFIVHPGVATHVRVARFTRYYLSIGESIHVVKVYITISIVYILLCR